MTAALRATGLGKRFGALVVTDDVSLTLAQGARHALIGPNGAGKTTLVGLLSGTLRPSAGRIELDGADITALPAHARVAAGLVRSFQVTNLFPRLTVLENVYLAASARARGHRAWFLPAGRDTQAREAAEAVLGQLGLLDLRHAMLGTIAYGRQRLVELAVSLVLRPRVLLLDEPAAGIPGGELPTLLAAMERLPPDIAILLIEHDMRIVRHFATEVTVLVAGRVLASGDPASIMASDEVMAVYLGQAGRARFGAAPHA